MNTRGKLSLKVKNGEESLDEVYTHDAVKSYISQCCLAFFFGAAGFMFQEEPTVNSVEVYMCVTLMRYPSGGGASEIQMR